MAKLRFTYFDVKGSRGQVARLLFDLADIKAEDNRISFQDFLAHKREFPFGAIPVLEIDGTMIAQCNGINRYIGKLAGLYPTDPLQALICDEIMDAVEDITNKVQLTIFMQDEEEKKEARKKLAEGAIPFYLRRVAAKLGEHGGEYFSDGQLTVADLKVFVWIRSLLTGVLDHVPTTLVETHAKVLSDHHDRVWALPKIRAHYE